MKNQKQLMDLSLLQLGFDFALVAVGALESSVGALERLFEQQRPSLLEGTEAHSDEQAMKHKRARKHTEGEKERMPSTSVAESSSREESTFPKDYCRSETSVRSTKLKSLIKTALYLQSQVLQFVAVLIEEGDKRRDEDLSYILKYLEDGKKLMAKFS